MSGFTVGLATFYSGTWHIDPSTETPIMSEQNAIMRGHELVSIGGFPLYTEYIDGIKMHTMIEFNGHLELAFMA